MERFSIALPRGELVVSVLRFPQSALVSVDDGAGGNGSLAIGVPALPSGPHLRAGEAGAIQSSHELQRPSTLTLSLEPFASSEQLESLAEKATVILGVQCFLRMAISDSRMITSPADLQTMEFRLLEGLRSLSAKGFTPGAAEPQDN